ncbi:copper transport protein ctr1, partial [Actinomortierella ambigua]
MSSLVVRNAIGAGGYGHVYHASWKGRKAAVKKFFVVQDEVRQSAAIQREIDILKKLADRHVIQFYGTTYHEDMLVLIMDYAEGGSLKRAIDGRRVTDWPTKKRIAQEIVRGLTYIHHEGVIHRDLKSLNILFTRYMEVKLCDFGLATLKVRSASSTTTLKGTIRWMAPELLVLKPKYSTKSDMYALGMVMWEMAANCTTPFQHHPNSEMVISLVKGGEREELPEDTPDDYRQWVER